MKDASNRWPLIFIAIILYLLITSHWILQVCIVWVSATRDKHFVQLQLVPTSTIQTTLYVTVSILADSMFTYRLFLVWGRKWSVIILPVLSMLSASITLIVLSVSPQPPNPHMPPAFWLDLPLFTTYLTTFVTNVYITAMISFKIWRNNRAMVSLGRRGLTSIIPVLIESAGIYTVSLAVTFIISFAMDPRDILRYMFASCTQPMLIPMVGITYSLLIVLVARGRDSDTKHRNAISTLAFQGFGTALLSDIPEATVDTTTDFELRTTADDGLRIGRGEEQETPVANNPSQISNV